VRHAGWFVGAKLVVTVKLIPGTGSVIIYVRPVVLLQETRSLPPKEESSMIRIWLFAVTAVVFTVAVIDPMPITKLPAGAESHLAGEAFELQFDNVPKDETTT